MKSEVKNSLKEYYRKHLGGVIGMFGGMFLGLCIANRKFDVSYLIIGFLVAVLLPIISWFGKKLLFKGDEGK